MMRMTGLAHQGRPGDTPRVTLRRDGLPPKWLAAALVLALAAAAALAWVSSAPPPPARFPGRYAVHGVDVSHHNGAIDWRQVAGAGIAFAWLNASEGGDFVDSRFAANAARAAGVRAGAYHFFSFCRPGAEQARHFLSVVAEAPLALPPAVDVELVGNCRAPPANDVIRRELETWLALVEAKLGHAVIHTTPDVDAALLGGLGRDRWTRSIPGEPRTRWRYWQFEPAGQVAGVDGAVDLDVFAGTLDELVTPGAAPLGPAP